MVWRVHCRRAIPRLSHSAGAHWRSQRLAYFLEKIPIFQLPAAWPAQAARQQGHWDAFSLPFRSFPMSNQINGPVPQADLDKALDLLKQARAIVERHLHPLTPKERKTLYKLGDKNLGFMQKIVAYATNTAAFVPSFISLEEVKQDVAVAAAFTPLEQFAAQLALDLNSTRMLAGSEGMDGTSPIYKNIKFLAEQKQPAAQGAYDDLSQQYPGRPAKKNLP